MVSRVMVMLVSSRLAHWSTVPCSLTVSSDIDAIHVSSRFETHLHAVDGILRRHSQTPGAHSTDRPH